MKFLKKSLGFFTGNLNKKNMEKLELEAIRKQMMNDKFDHQVLEELINLLNYRIKKDGEEQFQSWFSALHYRIPEEFEDKEFTRQFYLNHKLWIEKEIINLEKELKIPWEIQAEDLNSNDEKEKKVQLVIRHRLTEIVYSIMDGQ